MLLQQLFNWSILLNNFFEEFVVSLIVESIARSLSFHKVVAAYNWQSRANLVIQSSSKIQFRIWSHLLAIQMRNNMFPYRHLQKSSVSMSGQVAETPRQLDFSIFFIIAENFVTGPKASILRKHHLPHSLVEPRDICDKVIPQFNLIVCLKPSFCYSWNYAPYWVYDCSTWDQSASCEDFIVSK